MHYIIMGRLRNSQIHPALKRFARKPSTEPSSTEYSRFDLINGNHPWHELVPEGAILYPARKLLEGKIIYFNYELAKEMGLIPQSHKNELNPELRKKILDTFSLRIINEYDQTNNIRYHPAVVKPNKYMATRYLQLQHPDKCGRTSGDGRSIWNGCIEHAGVLWDISSRGTGVTALAPGVVEAGRPLESGNTRHGYGCGTADIDELIGAAIMAEVFHNKGLNTERVLTIIDIDGKNGIGVRAGKNLIRPAHFFAPLKQGNLAVLKKSIDYFIERQFKNKEWNFNSKSPRAYDQMLDSVIDSFAKFTAYLDRNYIFAWMDWDGDNALANAGIIDYGSIRQFGLRHDQYRYDDVERMSTTLNEQKNKIRVIIQTFIQIVDFIKTGERKPLETFAHSEKITQLDINISEYKFDYFLKYLGCTRQDRAKILAKHHVLVQKLYRSYETLETVKTHRKTQKVPDGINRPALLNMRKGIVFLTKKYRKSNPVPPTAKEFFKNVISKNAVGKDRKMTAYQKSKIQLFIDQYYSFIELFLSYKSGNHNVYAWKERVYNYNRTDRLTGDGVLMVVDEIMRQKKKELLGHKIQKAIEEVILHQTLNSGQKISNTKKVTPLTSKLIELIDGHSESI